MKKTMKFKKRGGFTLIEVMLVIVIIGIIVGIAAPKISGKLGKAQNVAARAGLKAVEILKGGKSPGDVPSSLTKKLKLVVNPKAAKAQGLDLAPKYINIADEVVK